MKNSLLLPVLSALLGAALLARPAAGADGELWVAPGGSDANPGTANAPLASLGTALNRWQTAPPNSAFTIYLRDGVYQLSRPILFQTSDFRPKAPLYLKTAPGEHPVLSGGVPVGNWQKLNKRVPHLPEAARGHIWVANAPRFNGQTLEFRQLWVADKKAVRAREPNDESLARLVAWNKTNQEATVPAAALGGIKKPAQLEVVVDQVWEIAVLRVKSIRYEGTNAVLTLKQPESRLEFEHPWPPVTVNAKYQAPFFLANALEFLDQPGEWFEDLAAGKVYYWPRAGEDMVRANVIAPAIETLVQIEGAPNRPVGDIHFEGITFSYTTWLRPSQQGHVPLQAGMYMLDAKKLSPKGTPYHHGLDNLAWIGRPPAAVSVKDAGQISFQSCAFEHLASAGLDFQSTTHNDLVQGCVFHDIGGNGLQLGKYSDTNVETHFPYNPTNETEICDHEIISDNIISDCGTEDWGCVGIGVGYARNIDIEHNDVSNLPYTGISVGWGWTKMTNALRDNIISANRIHHVGQRLGDLAGIYLLSAQPGTRVTDNYVSDISPSGYVPDPNHWFYLYLDEGSSFVVVSNNWCPSEKFLKNANGPGNLWTNNGPQVSAEVQAAAGLEPAFKNLFRPIK